MSTVVKFPYSASRRAYSRRPRISKNGTPEERAAKAAVKPRAATVTKISRGDFSFKPQAIKPKEMSRRYNADRHLVGIVEDVLRVDSATLKKKVDSWTIVSGDDWNAALIHDIKAASDGFKALADLFECAAARLETVRARLV